LIQLPPRFSFDLDKLEAFFMILPQDIRFAVEFRHRSWMRPETLKLLETYQVAYTVVDEPLLPPEAFVSSEIAYLRWHGRGKRPWYNYRYTLDELEPWVEKVKTISSKAKTVYGYFNNHFHGYAVENCTQMLELLGLATSQQAEARKKVQKYLNEGVDSSRTKAKELTSFFEPQT
jgi:uncharacterized protein YecE (DUF72 family)